MTREDHRRMQAAIARATRTAIENNITMGVVDHLYCETDEERFQYAPLAGLEMLYSPGTYGLINVIMPTGEVAWPTSLLVKLAAFIERHHTLHVNSEAAALSGKGHR
jgi:hypothetical protein